MKPRPGGSVSCGMCQKRNLEGWGWLLLLPLPLLLLRALPPLLLLLLLVLPPLVPVPLLAHSWLCSSLCLIPLVPARLCPLVCSFVLIPATRSHPSGLRLLSLRSRPFGLIPAA
jgi:hypothetical protein